MEGWLRQADRKTQTPSSLRAGLGRSVGSRSGFKQARPGTSTRLIRSKPPMRGRAARSAAAANDPQTCRNQQPSFQYQAPARPSQEPEEPRIKNQEPASSHPAVVRAGFTIVELLIVIGIVGVLVSLALPALSGAREASRKVSCANQLRQIGAALQMHHQQHQTFPPGVIQWRRTSDETHRRQLAWSVFLLPFLEQQNLFDQLDLSQAFDSSENAAAAETVVPVYVCPSRTAGTGSTSGRGPCDYGGIYGERIQSPNSPPKGIMIHDRPLSAASVRDGLSNTLIVAEDTGFADGEWINGRNLFDQAFPINAAPAFENDIRSEHPGGAQATLADGSVRFLSNEMNLDVLAAICTRDGGEMLGTW